MRHLFHYECFGGGYMKVYIDDFCKNKGLNDIIIKKFNNSYIFSELNKETEFVISTPEFASKINYELYPNLKYIQIITAGYDLLDLEKLKTNKIRLMNARGCFSVQIAEEVINKILVLNRNVRKVITNQQNHVWYKQGISNEIFGSTVLIVGAGSIGREIAARLKNFGTYIIGYKRTNTKLDNFDEIVTEKDILLERVKTSNIIILALPLSESSKYLFTKNEFLSMRESAVFINIARGLIIKEDDLIEVLKVRKDLKVGLDVFTKEPLDQDSLLWDFENVYITSHSASVSPMQYERIGELAYKNLKNVLENKEIINGVDYE
jgi:phosphoglycerate dehydrogenase-like enzyme